MAAVERVIVTAGASGIGLAIAQCFLAEGARVFIGDIDAQALRDACEANPGLEGALVDVADPRAVESFASSATSALGGDVSTLINNAGIGGERAPIEDMDLESWDRCVAVNLTGPLHLMQAVIPSMKQRGRGCIVNIVTSSVKTCLPLRTAYVASKYGLLGLSHNAARELGPSGIRVNAVLPGVIDNARGRALIENYASEKGLDWEAAKSDFLRYVSLRTLIAPSEVGQACVFLASDGARHITGQELSVDGNMEWEQ